MRTCFLPMGKAYAKVSVGNLFCMPRLQRGLNDAPSDPHVPDGTRRKDMARFRLCRGTIKKAAHGKLFHPINSETYGGSVSRDYAEIPSSDIEEVKALAKFFMQVAEIREDQEILLQRQRVVNDNSIPSLTVREGPHQDGVHKLGIFCVARTNIQGGVSLLYNDQRDIEFASVLEPGDLLLIDDSRMWHDTTPISRSDSSCPGSRDIIILTWPACREGDSALHDI